MIYHHNRSLMTPMRSSDVQWSHPREIKHHNFLILFLGLRNQVKNIVNTFSIIPKRQPMQRSVTYLRSHVCPSRVLGNVVLVLLLQRGNQHFDNLLSPTVVSLFDWVKSLIVAFDAKNVERCSKHVVKSSDDET